MSPGSRAAPAGKAFVHSRENTKQENKSAMNEKTNPGLFFPFIHRTGTHQSNSRALKETCGLAESRGWIAGIPFRLDPIAEPYE